jgi:biopolymer transport protein ExbD
LVAISTAQVLCNRFREPFMLAAPPRVAYINVTPMIDVMLVLLIVFMVVVPVIALQVDLPVALNPQSKPEEPDEIVMIIDRGGMVSLEISGRAVPGLALREQLAALYRERTRDRILYVKADSLLPFGVLEQAMVAARDAGVRVVAAVTQQRGRSKLEPFSEP